MLGFLAFFLRAIFFVSNFNNNFSFFFLKLAPALSDELKPDKYHTIREIFEGTKVYRIFSRSSRAISSINEWLITNVLSQ
jgi:hypothetical protein